MQNIKLYLKFLIIKNFLQKNLMDIQLLKKLIGMFINVVYILSEHPYVSARNSKGWKRNTKQQLQLKEISHKQLNAK